MAYKALYREWRPTRFEDVVEQEHVVKALRYSVSTGRIAHAYLFCGTRGTGKTTTAQILSRAVNCLNPRDGDPCNECEICREILAGSCVDVLEIDAASNNSVDNVRTIRDEVVYMPTKARRKVYIIDEVHMLSSGAFNALLKTLEEPPAHVLFILATTEPHKLPATILSRCQRFDFRRITHDAIVAHLEKISATGGVTLEKDAAALIARLSEGAMRDAISLLDQCVSLGGGRITYDDVLSVAGIVNDEFMTEFVDCMLRADVSAMLENIDLLVMNGRDIAQFVSDLVLYLRNMLICKVVNGRCDGLVEVPSAVLSEMKRQADGISQDEIIYRIKELSALEAGLKRASNPRVMLEVTLIRLNGAACRADENSDAGFAAPGKRPGGVRHDVAPAATGRTAVSAPASASQVNSADNITSVSNDTSASVRGKQDAGSGQAAAAQARADNAPITRGITEDYAEKAAGRHDKDARGDRAKNVGGEKAGASTAGHESIAAAGAPVTPKGNEFRQWPKVMDYLRSLGRMTIHSLLLHAKAIVLDDGNIALLFEPKENFIMTQVAKPEHIRLIEEAVLRISGRSMKVRCLDEESFCKMPAGRTPSQSDELIAKARSIADRAGFPLEIIDE